MSRSLCFFIILISLPLVGSEDGSLYQNRSGLIYGIDNRLDVVDTESATQQELASSVAAMVPKDLLKYEAEQYSFQATSIGEQFGLCEEEQFRDQPSLSLCSGFLVAPDVLLTAGHCVEHEQACESYLWVFDYEEGKIENSSFQEESVRKCKRILLISHSVPKKKILKGKKSEVDNNLLKDYALIELDRPVNRPIYNLRTEGKVIDHSSLIVIGHPSGLPTKITPKGRVVENQSKMVFRTNSDTYASSSGSPVIDDATNLVEGILITGQNDYKYNYDRGCFYANTLPELPNKEKPISNYGEKVFRATEINLKAIFTNLFFSSAANNDLDEVKRSIKRGIDPNLVRPDGEFTGFHLAIMNHNFEIATYLLKKKKVSPLQQLSNGDTILHWAIKKEDYEAVQYLISNNVSLLITNRVGETAQSLVENVQSPRLKALLKKSEPNIFSKILNFILGWFR